MTSPAYITPTIRLRKGEMSPRRGDAGRGLPIITAELELDPFDAALVLPDGERGDDGPVGEYLPPMAFQRFITDDAALPAGLGSDETGWTYANTTTRDVHVWDGGAWVHFAGVLAQDGENGPGNALTVTSSDSVLPAAGGASITGTSPQNLHLTLPIGERGPQGNPGPRVPLRQSEDYVEPEEGPQAEQLLGFTGLFGPVDPLALRSKYTLGEADFSEVTTANGDGWRLVAQIVLPPQPWPWRPMIFGGIAVDANSGTTVSTWTRCDMEVRFHNDEGQIVALGSGINSNHQVMCRAVPYFGDRDIVPEVQDGTVQAGESVTLVVVLRRIFGSRDWTHIRARGSLVVNMSPV